MTVLRLHCVGIKMPHIIIRPGLTGTTLRAPNQQFKMQVPPIEYVTVIISRNETVYNPLSSLLYPLSC